MSEQLDELMDGPVDEFESEKRAALVGRIDQMANNWTPELRGLQNEVRHRVYIKNEIQEAVANAALKEIESLVGSPVDGVDVLYFSIPEGRVVLLTGAADTMMVADFNGFGFDGSVGEVKVSPWLRTFADLEEMEAVADGLVKIVAQEIVKIEDHLQRTQTGIKAAQEPGVKQLLKAEQKNYAAQLEGLEALKSQDRKLQLAFNKIGQAPKVKKASKTPTGGQKKTAGESIIEGMRQAVAIKRGTMKPAKVTKRAVKKGRSR